MMAQLFFHAAAGGPGFWLTRPGLVEGLAVHVSSCINLAPPINGEGGKLAGSKLSNLQRQFRTPQSPPYSASQHPSPCVGTSTLCTTRSPLFSHSWHATPRAPPPPPLLTQRRKVSSRLAPLGRKGHTAAVVPHVGEPRVLIFGGAPAGRRGLSNAVYSVSLALLSAGAGTWERHRPTGTAPAPRQGHTLTPVEGGKRLVLFGGVAENGELLGDIQVRKGEAVQGRSTLGGS